jgi:hypothetical protein
MIASSSDVYILYISGLFSGVTLILEFRSKYLWLYSTLFVRHCVEKIMMLKYKFNIIRNLKLRFSWCDTV